jgi:hypothetical protein
MENNNKATIEIKIIDGDNKVSTSMYLEEYSQIRFLHNIHLGDDMIGSLIEELENIKQKRDKD